MQQNPYGIVTRMPIRVLPPAGFPTSVVSCGRAILAHRGSLEEFATALERRISVQQALLVSSGRAALTLALRVLAARSDRRIVAIPAYACYTVPASVVRAGLRIRLVDMDPQTFATMYWLLLRLDCMGCRPIFRPSHTLPMRSERAWSMMLPKALVRSSMIDPSAAWATVAS